MKLFRVLIFTVVSLSSVFFTSCREAKEGADELADEVTGKNKIEKKNEMEKDIKDNLNKLNEKQADALKNVTD